MPDPNDIPYVGLARRAMNGGGIDKIPIFGDSYRIGNAVLDFTSYACFPSWEVYVETLYKPAGTLVLGIVEFGIGDVLRGYFRPNGIRGIGGFNRLSRARGLGKVGPIKAIGRRAHVPELGNLIGRALPFSRWFRARNAGTAERWFWRIDGIAQQGLFYWLIADLTADFVVAWTTAIHVSEACKYIDPDARFGASRVGIVNSWSTWRPWYCGPPYVSIPHNFQPDHVTHSGPRGGHLNFGNAWEPYFGPYVGGSIGLFNDPDFNDPIMEAEAGDPVNPDGQETYLSYNIPPNRTVYAATKIPAGTLSYATDAVYSFIPN